jgi:uncharacterized protein YhaN
MRLLRLELLRYGHLADAILDFPPDAALHVVLGPNEAGKSTALDAIGDALFGIPERSARGFLHGNQALRIGFVLGAAGGRTARFVRRKGRAPTLRDAADAPVPDAALAPFLGGADRALFARGFGLDAAGLRAGGEELLRSGGDLAESLAAGMGLRHLHATLLRLDEAAKALHGDGRGRRRVAQALEAAQAARRAAEAAMVGKAEWEGAEAAIARLRAAIAEAQRQARALSAEGSRLERLRRVRPLLAALDAARREHAGLADAPPLPADAAETLRRATEARRLAERDLARLAAERQALDAERAAVAEDPAVLALGEAIDDLAERRPVAAQAEADLPAVRATVAVAQDVVADAARDLGAAADPAEAVRDRLPPAGLRTAARRLIQDRAMLDTRLAAARTALATAQRRHEAAKAALQAAPPPPDPRPLRRAIEAARGEGPLDAELAEAGRAQAAAAAALATGLAALPLWSGDAAALEACPLPLEAMAAEAARRLGAAAKAAETAREAEARLSAEIAQLEEEVVHLAAGETMPTAAVIAAAREARDRAWRLIRRGLDGGAAPGAADAEGLPDGPLPDAFEALRDAADRLADRRAAEAQRVADYALRQARLGLLRERQPALAGAGAAAAAEQAAAAEAWQALWAPLGLRADTPEAMAEWRRLREAVLRLAATAREAGSRQDGLAERHAAARAALAGHCPATAGAATLRAAIATAEQALAGQEDSAEQHRGRMTARDAEAQQLPELEDAATRAEQALRDFAPRWAEAAVALGLAGDATPEALQAALDAWGRIAEAASTWRDGAQRVADMARTVAAFAEAVRQAVAALPDLPPDEPATLAARRLERRLAEARRARDRAAALDGRIAAQREAAAEAARRQAEAAQDIGALQAEAGVADEPALEAAVAASGRRDALGRALRGLDGDLTAQGDGFAEAALRAEAATTDPDAAVARLGEIAAEQAALTERLSALGGDLARAEAALAGLKAGRDAALHAQAAADALAEARAAAERYARLHLARTLLRAGIERLRKAQQNPLLRAAGAHFATLTADRYVRLLAEEESGGHARLIAQRADGVECPVDALSEGTRDQLYLALRLAWVASVVAQGTCLPFIADDLLVQFDDGRAEAAIDLLVQLGATTQVILFTHHAHVAAMARRRPQVALLALPPVGPATDRPGA